jgi:DNA-directed RNA polymerase subunit RPC12/RpoP
MFRTPCQKCGKSLILPDKARLKRIRCPNCMGTFYINERSGHSATEESSSGIEAVEESAFDEIFEFNVIDPRVAALARRGRETRTKIALILQTIGSSLSAFAVLMTIIFLVIRWARAPLADERGIIIGLPAMLGWGLSTVAAGLAISGVRKHGALGYAISYGVWSTLHFALLIAIVVQTGRPIGHRPPWHLNELWSEQLGAGSGQLQFMTSALPYDVTLFGFFSQPLRHYAAVIIFFDFVSERIIPIGALTLIAGLAEIARHCVMAFWMRAVAQTSRAYDLAYGASALIVGMTIGLGVSFALNLLLGLFFINSDEVSGGPRTGSAMGLIHMTIGVQLLALVALMALFIASAVIADTLRRRVKEYQRKAPAEE